MKIKYHQMDPRITFLSLLFFFFLFFWGVGRFTSRKSIRVFKDLSNIHYIDIYHPERARKFEIPKSCEMLIKILQVQ